MPNELLQAATDHFAIQDAEEDYQKIVVYKEPSPPNTMYTFRVEHNLVEDSPLCIYDIECEEFESTFSDPDKLTSLVDFDPTAQDFAYGASVMYECGLARGFVDDTFEQNFTCGWDSGWKDSETLKACKCK